jgi:hypothetical protein
LVKTKCTYSRTYGFCSPKSRYSREIKKSQKNKNCEVDCSNKAEANPYPADVAGSFALDGRIIAVGSRKQEQTDYPRGTAESIRVGAPDNRGPKYS